MSNEEQDSHENVSAYLLLKYIFVFIFTIKTRIIYVIYFVFLNTVITNFVVAIFSPTSIKVSKMDDLITLVAWFFSNTVITDKIVIIFVYFNIVFFGTIYTQKLILASQAFINIAVKCLLMNI